MFPSDGGACCPFERPTAELWESPVELTVDVNSGRVLGIESRKAAEGAALERAVGVATESLELVKAKLVEFVSKYVSERIE